MVSSERRCIIRDMCIHWAMIKQSCTRHKTTMLCVPVHFCNIFVLRAFFRSNVVMENKVWFEFMILSIMVQTRKKYDTNPALICVYLYCPTSLPCLWHSGQSSLMPPRHVIYFKLNLFFFLLCLPSFAFKFTNCTTEVYSSLNQYISLVSTAVHWLALLSHSVSPCWGPSVGFI